MFARYIEIYTTLDMEKYYRVKNIFAENKIPYKDTSTNNQLRLSLNNVRGTNPALLRDSGVKNTYSISVKKEDEHKARQLIQGKVYLVWNIMENASALGLGHFCTNDIHSRDGEVCHKRPRLSQECNMHLRK